MKNRAATFALAVIAVTAFLTPNAYGADSFKCKKNIIKPGDEQIEVKLKCGEPIHVTEVGYEKMLRHYEKGKHGKPLPPGQDYWTETVFEYKIEKWYYDTGKRSLMKILTFRGGVLIKIEDGEKM